MEIWKSHLANRAETTRDAYETYVAEFIEWSELSPDQIRQLKLEEEEDNNLKPWQRQKVENLVRGFLAYLETRPQKGKRNKGKKGISGSSRGLALCGIRSFFRAQGLPLRLDRSDQPEKTDMNASERPSREEIKKIIDGCNYLRERCLILFLKDSGLRESDLEGLRWRDLNPFPDGFMGFILQTKKKKTKARPFVGPETTSLLELYKRQRLFGTEKIPPEKNLEDHPIFALFSEPEKGLKPDVMSKRIGDVIRLVGIENVSAHGLRKFWEDNVHVQKPAHQKQLNGRKLTRVEKAYHWKTREELFQIYKENYDNLRVMSKPLTKELEALETRIRGEREEEIAKLRARLFEFEQREAETKRELGIPDVWTPELKKAAANLLRAWKKQQDSEQIG